MIGLLGPQLDAGKGVERWERWRPTVSMFQHEDLAIDRLELLHESKFTALRDVVAADVAAVSPGTEVRAHELTFRDAWDFCDVYAALHDFARAYPWDTDAEDYLVHITTGTHVAQICLFLLTEAGYFPGLLVQASPPPRWGTGPGEYHVVDLDLSKYDRLASRFERELVESTSILKGGIATRNERFNRLIDRVERVAVGSRAPILLTGPTGAGKSQLAKRVYELKRARRQLAGPFVEVNCATLRGDGAMSALFGHTKGAFTGATGERAGLLRAADGGLLFLDEVGELGADEQAMLLRAIEEKRFLPVGSDKESRSDFQLVAGTNRDLAADVACGRFREDLLARINLWTFELPPLRERREDIEPNLAYELEQFARRDGRNVAFNKEARERFLRFATSPEAAWAGNFRDLNAAVTRMATLSAGGRITVDGVDDEIDRLKRQWAGLRGGAGVGGLLSSSAVGGDCEDLLAEAIGAEAVAALDRFDRVQLAEVLKVCRDARSLSEAGRALFAASRTSKAKANDADRLRKYLARFGVDWRKLRPAGVEQ
ncbi:MAG TPA: RNA repair transcriptional activator RtcR [Humisphaera sp.]